MRSALLLVDVQHDYLARPGISPPATMLIARIAALAEGFRKLGLPVLHAHTRIARDGSNRMAHLRDSDTWWCVEGTPGAAPPPQAAPQPGEAVFFKHVYNAFQEPALAAHLASIACDNVVIAGVHLHACVRETALAAYQAGYAVCIADDAVASYDLLHAEITRSYLRNRGIEFLAGAGVLARLGASLPDTGPATAAWIEGNWLPATTTTRWERRNPAHWDQVLDVVGEASDAQLERAAVAAARAQREWAARTPESRAGFLRRFADALQSRSGVLATAMATEVGKPLAEARTEAARAVEHLHAALTRFGENPDWLQCGPDVHARRAPLGVVAAITPFNHPLGIAIGKLAPALALGNAVVWKPALAAATTARTVVEALAEAGLPPGLVAVVFGDGYTAQRLVRQPHVGAVTLTASVTAGRQLAALCGEALKPFQGELGGNNAVIVAGDVDPAHIARDIARSAFSFAGQRCTAGRRILVERRHYDALVEALAAEAAAMRIGDPLETTTEIGPLVSRAQQEATASSIDAARARGARVIHGGEVPNGFSRGCWYSPTLLGDVKATDELFCTESFAPVALVTPVAGIEEAIMLANAVPHGLVATLYTRDEAIQQRFLSGLEAGVLKLNQPPAGVHPAAPFGGWKASGLGPPEHGAWDAEFYSRAQAVYGFSPPPGDRDR